MKIHFPNSDLLELALSGAMVPPAVASAPARTGGELSGPIWIAPTVELSSERVQSLARFGITSKPDSHDNGIAVDHWWQVLPVTPAKTPAVIGPQTPVLFEIRDARHWPDVVNELLRLGNDRQTFRVLDGPGGHRVLLHVYGPPYYSLLRTSDSTNRKAVRAYVEAAPRVWVEWGHAYPLATQLQPAEGQIVLLRPTREWETIADAPFRDVYDAIEFANPSTINNGSAAASPSTLTVDLTLAPANRTDAIQLWVVRRDALTVVDAFVESADDAIVQRFSVAVGEADDQPLVVIRLRPSSQPPVELTMEADGYRSFQKLPNLFVPQRKRLQPPLQRETVRRLLAPDPAVITWLEPVGDLSFRLLRIADDAFRPLSSWREFVLDRERDKLTLWAQATEFAMIGVPVREEQPKPRTTSVAKPKSPRLKEPPAPVEPVVPPRVRHERRAVAPITPPTGLPATDVELREQLTKFEEQFLAVEGELDHATRQQLWPRLAQLNAQLRQPAESALAWAHALWERQESSDEAIWAWVRAESALTEPSLTSMELDRLLAMPKPDVSQLRSLAAILNWSARQQPTPPDLLTALPRVRQYLQDHDHLLPVRIAWLAWTAWCRLSAGDSLTLARMRDRMLARLLDRGLEAELDLPAFLRFAGRADADRLRQIREWVEEVRGLTIRWIQKDLQVEHATTGYVDLLFAFAQARLGEPGTARALVRRAAVEFENAADDTREAHDFLLQALSWRVEQVLAGRGHGGPLPHEQLEYLAQMHTEAGRLPTENIYNTRRTGPYAVERLREQSRVLEPQEKYYPYRHTLREGDPLIEEAARLPDVRDSLQLPGRVNDLLRRAERSPESRLRVLAECVALAGRLGAETSSKLLDRVVPALDAGNKTDSVPALEVRLRLLERSLFFAAHYDRTDLVPLFVERLMRLFESSSAGAAIDASGQALGQTLRSLRKLGLRESTLQLLERSGEVFLRGLTIDEARTKESKAWPGKLQNLLHLAAGWQFFDQAKRAKPIIDEARSLLQRAGRSGSERLTAQTYTQIACNYVSAVGFGPPNLARERIAELFDAGWLDKLPNTFTTSPFYSRFHLNVVEAVVLTLASDDFAIGPAAKRWLDDDEYLIRRRIHRDVRDAVAREG